MVKVSLAGGYLVGMPAQQKDGIFHQYTVVQRTFKCGNYTPSITATCGLDYTRTVPVNLCGAMVHLWTIPTGTIQFTLDTIVLI